MAAAHDEAKGALGHDRLTDGDERDLDLDLPEAHEAVRGHVEVAAETQLGVSILLAPLDGDPPAHRDDALTGGEHHADPLVGLDGHDPLVAKAAAGVVGQGVIRGRAVHGPEIGRMAHRRSMTGRNRRDNRDGCEPVRNSWLRIPCGTYPNNPWCPPCECGCPAVARRLGSERVASGRHGDGVRRSASGAHAAARGGEAAGKERRIV